MMLGKPSNGAYLCTAHLPCFLLPEDTLHPSCDILHLFWPTLNSFLFSKCTLEWVPVHHGLLPLGTYNHLELSFYNDLSS